MNLWGSFGFEKTSKRRGWFNGELKLDSFDPPPITHKRDGARFIECGDLRWMKIKGESRPVLVRERKSTKSLTLGILWGDEMNFVCLYGRGGSLYYKGKNYVIIDTNSSLLCLSGPARFFTTNSYGLRVVRYVSETPLSRLPIAACRKIIAKGLLDVFKHSLQPKIWLKAVGRFKTHKSTWKDL